jgi:DNA-binding transcriptional regulator PaaX
VTAWHLLIHSIPPRPLYLRAKVRQRLERLGAVALKNSVYVLPAGDETLEDLQWLAGEIVAGGGQAYIASGQLLFGVTEEEMVAAFRAARQSDYESLL